MANITDLFGGLETVAPTITGAAEGFDWANFLQSDQFSNLLGTGTDLWGAYQSGQAMSKQFDIAEQSMAMAQDVYARDKEAEERRQSLSFA